MIPLLLSRLRRFLSDHSPVWCTRCQSLLFAKNARHYQHVTGAVVPICKECEAELYHPFERSR